MLVNYFFSYTDESLNVESSLILGLKNSLRIKVGDMIKIFYSKKGSSFFFEGFCFAIHKRSYLNPDCSFHLINKMGSSIVSFVFSFFYNLVFSFEKVDFKKARTRYRFSRIIKFRKMFII
jgi:hypothetical protein